MPYAVQRRGSRYCVINADTGEVKAKHTSKTKAERQVQMLRGIEHGWKPTGEPNTYTRKIGNQRVKLKVKHGGRS